MNRRTFITSTVATLALPTPPPPLIDSHVHVWKHDPTYPFAPTAHPPAFDASAETLLDLMAANGVSNTVLIQVIHYQWDNAYLASVLKRYPTRFKGVCRVNPNDPAAPDHLTRLTEVDGFHGVRLSPAAGPEGDWIRGPLMPPLWRTCAHLKVPMTLLLPASRIPDLIPLIESNPGLTIVIDHMADTALDDQKGLANLLTLARYPHVSIKISHLWTISHQPYPYPDTIPRIQQLAAAFTPARLMWGTDYPISLPSQTYAQTVSLYRDHMPYLTPAAHQQILSTTVQKVWPFA